MAITHLKFPILAATMLTGAFVKAQEPIKAEDMPQAWHYASEYEQTVPTDDAWWHKFADPTLDSLMTIGINNNYNVLQAQRRIEIARQTLRQSRSGYYPAFTLQGGWNKSRQSGMTGTVAANAVNSSYFDLGVNMNWEIDVFGKVTARARESKAQFNATRAEYDAVMVSIGAKIATAYFQLRSLQTEIEVLTHHIASQKRVMEITKARFDAGLSSALDVAQSSTTYYSTLASITALRTNAASAINSLAVLLGLFPEQLAPMLQEPKPMPDYRQIVAVGAPMELLRRRPDVAEAEYTLAQYAAALGVAKKDFLPTLALTGSIGTSAHRIGDLFTDRSLSYTIAPTLSWTIFDGLSREAGIESAKQQMLAGIDNYNLTVLTAVQEVETSMTSYSNDLQYIDYLNQVVEQAEKAFTLSVDLYKQGLTDFINVTNSQINLLQYSNELVVAQGQALADLVSLYQALGGGWNL